MYYSPLTSNYLYSIETKYLRANPQEDAGAVQAAFDNVKNLGQRGGNANGFTGDSLGNVYMLMPEHNGIFIYKWVVIPPTNVFPPADTGTWRPVRRWAERCPSCGTRASSGPTRPTWGGTAIST